MTKSEAAKICQSIKFMMDIEDYSEAVEEALNMAIEALEQEPKRGKWYIREYEFFTCDQCGEDVLSFAESTSEAKRKLKNGDFPNYCPDCGARMERDEE